LHDVAGPEFQRRGISGLDGQLLARSRATASMAGLKSRPTTSAPARCKAKAMSPVPQQRSRAFWPGLTSAMRGQELFPSAVESQALQIVDQVVARRQGAEEGSDQRGPLFARFVILVAHAVLPYPYGMASAIQAGPRSDLLITGMNCANCARNVTDALQGVAGVASADVSLQDGPGARALARRRHAQSSSLVRSGSLRRLHRQTGPEGNRSQTTRADGRMAVQRGRRPHRERFR
jgi:copper chaperone CopZ